MVERMQCELFHSVPALVDAYLESGKKAIPFAPLAVRLINLVEAIHKSKNILLDVKPDNLMIDSNVKLSKQLTTEALAKSIRLVDFGLLKSFYGTDGDHVPNLPTGEVQGTPLYASLHVHDLQTPARRDDLYAMVLVIADLLLHIHGALNHKKPPYGAGKGASYFPWSQEPSDSAIGKVKATQLNDCKSPFFASMPSTAIVKTFVTALEQVHQTDFARLPNYDAIRTLFSNIQVPISEASKIPAEKTKKKRIAVDDVANAVASPLRRSVRHVTYDAMSLPTKTMPPIEDVEMEDADVVMMNEDEENVKPPAKSTRNGLQLIVTGGPNNNVHERIVLDNTTATITIGSSAQKSSLVLADLSPSHVRLSFSKNHNAAFVEPLGKSAVQVNRMKVGATGMMAFIGQSISFGGYTVASVQPLIPVDDEPMIIDGPDLEVSNSRSSRVVKKKKVEETPQSSIQKKTEEYVPNSQPTLMLQVISPNSLKGTQFSLEYGVTLVFGSEAAAKKSTNPEERCIHLDHTDVAPRHMALSLVIQQGTRMVQVRDLKSPAGTFVNNLRVQLGKNQMAFTNSTIRIGDITMVVKK
jgi:serine/threonine protein kinase